MKKINFDTNVSFSGVLSKIKKLSTKLYLRIEHWNLKKIVRMFVLVGLILGTASAWFGYTRIYMSPERRFWIAINNSMAVPSITRTLTQGGSGNQVIQDHRFYFAPQRVVENKVTFSTKNATTNTSVVTEGIVYPEEQFLRYSSFSTNQKDNGNPVSLDELLGLWATDKDSGSDPEQSNLSYTSELVSLVVMGNYPSAFRREILAELKNGQVYGNSLGEASEVEIDGKKVIRYSVSVDLKKYTAILQKAFVEAGYGEFPPLNPDNYREGAKVNAGIAIDKKSNTIATVEFGGRTENYSNYGLIKNIQKPTAAFTIDELQSKVEQKIGNSL